MLKLRQDQAVLEVRQEFERKAKDLQQKYKLRMQTASLNHSTEGNTHLSTEFRL